MVGNFLEVQYEGGLALAGRVENSQVILTVAKNVMQFLTLLDARWDYRFINN